MAKSVDRLRLRESEIGDADSSPVFNHGAGFGEFFGRKAAELPTFASTAFGGAGIPIWTVAGVSSPANGLFITWTSVANVALVIYPTGTGTNEYEPGFLIQHVDGINRANPNDVLHQERLCDGVAVIMFRDGE